MLFLKENMHVFVSHLFLFCCMFLTHTHTATHQAIRCDLGMLTDYCSYQVSFSTTPPASRGQSYLKLFPRHFYIPALTFIFYQQLRAITAVTNSRGDPSVYLACLLYTTMPQQMKISFSSKHRTQRNNNVCRGHPIAQQDFCQSLRAIMVNQYRKLILV